VLTIGILASTLISSTATPLEGPVVQYHYERYVGPVYVTGHGYYVPNSPSCEGWGDNGMLVPSHLDGARIFPTEERLRDRHGCGAGLWLFVYQEPMIGSCNYACQTGTKNPSVEEVKAKWNLIASAELER
jgi:hypothetical protein